VYSVVAAGLVVVTNLIDHVLWNDRTAEAGCARAKAVVDDLGRQEPSLHVLFRHHAPFDPLPTETQIRLTPLAEPDAGRRVPAANSQ
jgi:hypothetical protein